MLDLRFIRENAELVKEAVQNKNEKVDVDKILELDEAKRVAQFNFDQKKAEQNRVSKEIGLRKKKKEDATDLLAQMGSVAQEIKDLRTTLSEAEAALQEQLMWIPNMPHELVPVGKTEDDNQVLREWGTKREFNFQPLDHVEIAEKNGLLDLE